MKSFKNFLNESYVGKDGKIYASKGEYEKTVKLLNKTFKTDNQKHTIKKHTNQIHKTTKQ